MQVSAADPEVGEAGSQPCSKRNRDHLELKKEERTSSLWAAELGSRERK